MSAEESETKQITFYKIPDRVKVYLWSGQEVCAIRRRDLDSEGNEICTAYAAVRPGDWIMDDNIGCEMAVSDRWLRKFYEERPTWGVAVQAPSGLAGELKVIKDEPDGD